MNAAYENYGRLYVDPAIERHYDKEWEHSVSIKFLKALLQLLNLT